MPGPVDIQTAVLARIYGPLSGPGGRTNRMLKSILSFILGLIAPIILTLVGAFIVGFGIHMEWEWVTNAGLIVALIGVIWTVRMWWED